MIVSYRTKETAAFYRGERVKVFDGIRGPAQSKLDRLEVSESLLELSVLPGNRLEALKGDRKGQYSIRINESVAHLLSLGRR